MQPAHLDSRSGLQVDAEVTAHSHLPLTRSPPRPCRCGAEVRPHLQRDCASQREQLRLASQGRWDSLPGGLGLLAEQNPAPRWVRPAPRLHSRGCRRQGHSGLRQILQSPREGLFCPGSRPPFKGPGASFLTLSCDVRPAGPGAGVHPSREGRRRHPTGSWPQLRPTPPQPGRPAPRAEGPRSSADRGRGLRRKQSGGKAPPGLLSAPRGRLTPCALRRAHLSPRLTCDPGRRTERRARAAAVGPGQPAGSAPWPGGRPEPSVRPLGPSLSPPPYFLCGPAGGGGALCPAR